MFFNQIRLDGARRKKLKTMTDQTKDLQAENKKLKAKINRLNIKIGEQYKTINDLLEESNALIADIKTQREESDKEINRLMQIIEAKDTHRVAQPT